MSEVHPLLRRAFDELREAGVSWALLRGADELGDPVGDVDLLISRTDAKKAATALERAGFRRLHAWGHGSHRFFIGFDRDDGTWIKLDVVTELAFGPYQALPTRTEAPVIARAHEANAVRTLNPDDAFWALLLHCLADRGDIPPRHAAALASTVQAATATSPLAHWIDPENAIAAARSGDWGRLSHLGDRLARRSPRYVWRVAKGKVLLALTPVFTPFYARGPTVALLGPDGAGKSTVADELERAFPFHHVRRLYLGLYSPATEFRGPSFLRLPARLAWLVRMRAQILRHRLRGRVVVLDRHTYDALLPQPEPSSRFGRARIAVLAHGAPAPDVLVLLDAPPDVMAARKPEHFREELAEQRRRYLELAERLADVHVSDTTQPITSIVRGIVLLVVQSLH